MIVVVSNLLVYVHRESCPWHEVAISRLTQLAEGRSPWVIPWPCPHEFLALVS
jgi:uncharacterized protein